MSVYLIYYQAGAKMMRPLTSESEYRQLRDSSRQQSLVSQARQGNLDAKRHLLQMNYSCLPTEDGHLRGATQMSNSVGMDVDLDRTAADYDEQMRRIPERILAMKDELGLLMLERSASKGYHIVFRRRPDLSQEDNLRWASTLLGVQYDEGAKDITRVFYSTTASPEDLLFLSPSLFENSRRDAENAEFLSKSSDIQSPTPCHAELAEASCTQSDTQGVTQGERPFDYAQGDIKGNVILNGVKDLSKESVHPADAAGATRDLIRHSSHQASQSPAALNDNTPKGGDKSDDNPGEQTTLPPRGEQGEGAAYLGVPYSLIISERFNLTNSGKLPVKSNRDALTYELAVNLRNICGFDREVLARVIPCYDEFPEAEKMKCIDSALQSARTQMPSRLKQAIHRASLKMQGEQVDDDYADGTGVYDFLYGEQPPQRPKRLPSVLRLLTSNVPERQVPTTAMSVFPALGVHLCGVTIRDTDNTSLEPAFMHLQIARSSSGKSCINQPVDMILADIKESDRKARDERREWAKTCKKLGANKEKPPRPTSCVQVTDINMTAAALTQLLYDAEQAGNKSLYTRMDEVEMLSDLGAGNGLGQRGVSKILRLGFDHAMWGQERVGVDSVCERAPLRWFWNASGTIQRCVQYLGGSIADGTLSRLTLSTITERGARPVYGEYGADFAAQLKPYILRLSAANGEVRCPQAERLAGRLSDDISVYLDTLVSEDDVVSAWAPRAVTMALMRGVVLYIAEGYQWSKDIENFMVWSYQYDMWCKYHFFGERAEAEMMGEEVKGKIRRGRPTVLNLLGEVFSMEDLEAQLTKVGKNGTAKALIAKWKCRKMVRKTEDGTYCKVLKTE